MKKTVVIGASENPERYSHKAVISLSKYGEDVVAVGLKNGFIAHIPITKEKNYIENVERGTRCTKKLWKSYHIYTRKLEIHENRLLII